MAGDNVYVVSAEPGPFDATVATAVVPDEHDDAPAALAGGGEVRLWRVDDEELFDQLTTGDVVLFYHDGRYVGVGTVGEALRDDGWTAETFWDGDGPETVFTVAEFEAVDLSRAAVHAIFDYSANYYPSTPMQVPGDRVEHSTAAIHSAVVRYDRES